jgi:hypothetical protein
MKCSGAKCNDIIAVDSTGGATNRGKFVVATDPTNTAAEEAGGLWESRFGSAFYDARSYRGLCAPRERFSLYGMALPW